MFKESMKKVGSLLLICVIVSVAFGCGGKTTEVDVSNITLEDIVSSKITTEILETIPTRNGKCTVKTEITIPDFSKMDIADMIESENWDEIKSIIVSKDCPLVTETIESEEVSTDYDEETLCSELEKEVLAKNLVKMIDCMEGVQDDKD